MLDPAPAELADVDQAVHAVGGLMLATGLDARHVYYVCIVPALVAAVAIALVRWRPAEVDSSDASTATGALRYDANR